MCGDIYADGANVEIHDSTFLTNTASAVSSSTAVLRHFLELSAPITGVGHATFRREGQSTLMMELLSSMIRPLTPTLLTR